jgi:hypothetical protein
MAVAPTKSSKHGNTGRRLSFLTSAPMSPAFDDPRGGTMRFSRVLLAAGLVGAAVAAPSAAFAAPAAGSCTGGAFAGSPHGEVSRGQVIRLALTENVTGDAAVPGCARDVLLAGPVGFVSAAPGGAYWPSTSYGPVAEVSWTGTFPPGTVLPGTIVLKVAASAAHGAVITATSGSALTFTVR